MASSIYDDVDEFLGTPKASPVSGAAPRVAPRPAADRSPMYDAAVAYQQDAIDRAYKPNPTAFKDPFREAARAYQDQLTALDYSPSAQLARMEMQKPVRDSEEYRRAIQYLPQPMSQWERDIQKREARMAFSDARNSRDPRTQLAGATAALNAQNQVEGLYQASQLGNQAALAGAYGQAAAERANRNNTTIQELQQRAARQATIAQQALQNAGFAYGTDAQERLGLAELGAELRMQDLAEKDNALLRRYAYGEDFLNGGALGGELGRQREQERRETLRTKYNEGLKKFIDLGGDPGLYRKTYREDSNPTDAELEQLALLGNLAQRARPNKPGIGGFWGTPRIQSPIKQEDQPSAVERFYNEYLGEIGSAAGALGGLPGLGPLAYAYEAWARKPGMDDLVIQTDQGPAVIPGGRNVPNIQDLLEGTEYFRPSPPSVREQEPSTVTAPDLGGKPIVDAFGNLIYYDPRTGTASY